MTSAAVDERQAAEQQERRTSYLELFFDLVFVFAITQVTALLLADPSAAGFLRAALILGLIWWAWSGYAWMTNAIEIDRFEVRLLFLVGTAGAFFMALAVPEAFGAQGLWFAVPYLVVRMIQLVLYLTGIRNDPAQLRALMGLVPWFLVAPLIALVGGFLEGDARTAVWALSLAIDVVGTLTLGEENDFRISPAHFAERYGLFVIIALGESIVAIGVGAEADPRNLTFAIAVVIAFSCVAALWWAYFDFASTGAERALRFAEPRRRGPLARDVFTLFHYPQILGIIFVAVAAKKVLAHPDEPLSHAGRAALGLGISLGLLSVVLARYRIVHVIAWERIGGMVAAPAAVIAFRDLDAMWLLSVIVAILIAVLSIESYRLRVVRGQIRSGGPRISTRDHTSGS
jgi:low temperature requirement protein LtrA